MKAQLPKRVLVTGATGSIAPILIWELVRHGHRVTCLVRREPPKNLLPPEVRLIRGDLIAEAVIRKACENAEWIFHLAAKLHIQNPSAELNAEYQAVNVAATKNLIEQSRPFCEKFIFFSTINVYGASENGVVFDENSQLNPSGIYAQSKADAEKSVLEAGNGIVLRLAAVYGERMKGNYPKLLAALQKGRFIYPGDGENRRTLIHAADVGRAAMLSAASDTAVGRVYNVTDGEIHTFRQIVEAMSAALERKPPRLRVPLPPLRAGFKLLKTSGRLIGRDWSEGLNLLEKLTEDIAVSGAKIERELGFQPLFNLETGWKDVVLQQSAAESADVEKFA